MHNGRNQPNLEIYRKQDKVAWYKFNQVCKLQLQCVFCINYAILYAFSYASIRQELFPFTALIKFTAINWSWNLCCSIHWWSMVLWWTKFC